MSGKEAKQSVMSCPSAIHRMWSKKGVIASEGLWEPWVQVTRVASVGGGNGGPGLRQ